jgi:putative ABC transport system permease protein
MLRAFRWNLRVLSYISLVVGAFLIYNTIAIGVVRRRAEIGILRALGAPRRAVFTLFLAEALTLGLLGAAAGIGIGRALAGLLLTMVSSTVNALFTTSRPAPVHLTGVEVIVALAAGALAAVLSAFGPAREAAEAHPTEAMSRGAHEHRSRIRWRRGLLWAACFGLLAAAAAQLGPVSGFPLFGYVAAFLSIGAATAAAPALVTAAARASRGRTWESLQWKLAGRSLSGSLGRTSVVVAALATAIAMMASVGIMVGSFRETVRVWLDVQLRADLFVRAAATGAPGSQQPLPPDVPALLRSTPGVAQVGVLHSTELTYRGERATIGGGDVEPLRQNGGLRFLAGEDRDAILRSLIGQDRAIISEPFATKFHLRPGDPLTLDLGTHRVTFPVAGIYYDYSSSQGWVIVDRPTLLRYLPDLPAASASVYLAPGADLNTVHAAIERRLAADSVFVEPNRELRRISMEIFDRTFAITWALEAVAILVAMLGAANALLAMALDRRRELALLRYLGASRPQVRGMILAEAAWIGLLSTTLGLALGVVLSLLLVLVVNKQSFGWSIQFHPPILLISAEMALIWLFTVVAGLYPAQIAATLDPASAIHEE